MAFTIVRRLRRRLAAAVAAATILACAAAATLLAVPALAAPPKAAALNLDDRANVQRVEQYLNGIRTLTARFTQYSPEGGTAEGVLYLSRPGHMRFEYDAPTPIMLLADGTWVIYYDKSLKQVSYLPIGSTPAWFLLRNDISLEGDVTITRFERGPGVLRATLVETKHPENGTVTLTLSDKPMELKQWSLVDAQGKTTTVVLSDLRVGVPVDPNVFVFNDPRPRGPQGGQ
jgi:outer membrane lipoprotein-sorting protein